MTCEKVNAYVQIKMLEKEIGKSSVLPTTNYEADFSRKKAEQMRNYRRIDTVIQWKDIGRWAACTACLGGSAYYLF